MVKRGKLYSSIRDKIKSFDIIFFKGNDFVSKTILKLEKHGNKIPESGGFTHVGLCLKYDILKYIPELEGLINEDTVYVWESSISGELGSKVYNIYGETFLGVQLRNFDELIVSYDDADDTAIAIGSIKNNPIKDKENIEELGSRFREIFNRYNGCFYDANCCSLCSTVFKCCRGAARKSEKVLNTEDWYFCSELVASVFRDMGIINKDIDPKTVTPVDLCYFSGDQDFIHDKKTRKNSNNKILIKKLTYITSPKHFVPHISDIEYDIKNVL